MILPTMNHPAKEKLLKQAIEFYNSVCESQSLIPQKPAITKVGTKWIRLINIKSNYTFAKIIFTKTDLYFSLNNKTYTQKIQTD